MAASVTTSVTIIGRVLALLLCLLVGGCVDSEAPLSPLAPLPHGDPLIGAWVAKDKDETIYLHFGNEGQAVRMIEIELDAKGNIKTDSYLTAAVKLGGNRYLSVQTPQDDRILYTLIKYRLSRDHTLTLWPANYKFLETAIKDGLIAGTTDPSVPGVRLTADQQTLQRFVSDYDKRIFPEAKAKLRRLH